MNFELTEEQKLLREAVSSFARREAPVSRSRALREDGIGYSRDVWHRMGEFGWLGAMFPESVGGLGGSFVEAALVLEGLATTLVPEPILASLAGGLALARAGSEEQQTRFLSPMVQGETTLALAYAEEGSRFDLGEVRTSAERRGSGYRLAGEKRIVLNGHAADEIIVSARTAGGPADPEGLALFVVGGKAPGLEVVPIQLLDGRRGAVLRFHGVEVGEDRRLGSQENTLDLLEELADFGAAAACVEGAVIARTVLEMTTEYLKTREQFGVKIGSFQALQHRAVDMFVEVELCKSMAILATIRMSEPARTPAEIEERKGAVSAAKVQLAVGGRFVTQQAIQLHGGIGITDEHDVGLYFKRMHVLNTLFGDEEHHVARFASLSAFEAGAR